MTQELTDLRNSIIQGRYADALAIVDELEGMSKKVIGIANTGNQWFQGFAQN
ncbi:hypothetical protein NWP17_01300 [Chrysosporum bergii ANA360D]|jgi:hypothetical protein|uniref:Uncharacterized protein n=1 Tax=Chrysosporum bergii ANA360D TaxID=617107 RepID=A0AA43GNW3_9CYAN|nr:hypothetical protein [Chrysosporum bergii]MDH6059092.1 hypothetical protein [Chrysosporum bergii ANA360D]